MTEEDLKEREKLFCTKRDVGEAPTQRRGHRDESGGSSQQEAEEIINFDGQVYGEEDTEEHVEELVFIS